MQGRAGEGREVWNERGRSDGVDYAWEGCGIDGTDPLTQIN